MNWWLMMFTDGDKGIHPLPVAWIVEEIIMNEKVANDNVTSDNIVLDRKKCAKPQEDR